MRSFIALSLGMMVSLAASSTAYADVQITLNNGRATIVAKDATARQILEEWARIGQTRVVNVERLSGGLVTLQLLDIPEQTALDVILRSASGYFAAPRATVVPNASAFDRIMIMPPSTPPPAVATRPAGPVFPQPGAQPQFGQPSQAPNQVADDDPDDERAAPNAPNRGPVFNAFPQPQVVNPQGAPAQFPGVAGQQQMPPGALIPNPPSYPGAPANQFGGTAVPGMIVQPPVPTPTPTQTVPPGMAYPPGMVPPTQVPPGQQVRRPGGQ